VYIADTIERMRFDLANLPTDTATLHQIIATQAAVGEAREAELAAAKAGLIAKALEIEKLKLQLARLRRMQFGRSSEKIVRTIEQLELRLEELETETPTAVLDASAREAEPPATIEQTSSSKRLKSERRALPAHLPCRQIVHEPSCTCPKCGGEMREVGEDVTKILDYVPGHFEVVKHPAGSVHDLSLPFSSITVKRSPHSPMPTPWDFDRIVSGLAGRGITLEITARSVG
jgi:transposase